MKAQYILTYAMIVVFCVSSLVSWSAGDARFVDVAVVFLLGSILLRVEERK